ncbi:hypothetical protein KY285_031979 [Solanum tuberosum]|nr:hypothetical protein KY285_031979 [Solanum tuberosum]
MDEHQEEAQPTPSVAVPVRFTWPVKKALDEGLILMEFFGFFTPDVLVDPITIHDETSESDITRKGKRKMVLPTHKKQVRLTVGKKGFENRGLVDEGSDSTGVKNWVVSFETLGVHDNDEGGGEENLSDKGITKNIEDCLDACSHRILNFTQRSVIRGMIIIGFGGDEMGELLFILKAQGLTNLFLQGNKRRKIVRKEMRPFYINASGSPILISSVVSRMLVFLKADVISQILGLRNLSWCHYVKRKCPTLDG